MNHSIMLQRSVRIHIKFFFQTVNLFFLINFQIFENYFLENNSSTTRVLLFMSIPGHLTFVSVIWKLAADQPRFTILFIFLYVIAALIQVRSNFSKRNSKLMYH
jgi:hypothetical protein